MGNVVTEEEARKDALLLLPIGLPYRLRPSIRYIL